MCFSESEEVIAPTRESQLAPCAPSSSQAAPLQPLRGLLRRSSPPSRRVPPPGRAWNRVSRHSEGTTTAGGPPLASPAMRDCRELPSERSLVARGLPGRAGGDREGAAPAQPSARGALAPRCPNAAQNSQPEAAPTGPPRGGSHDCALSPAGSLRVPVFPRLTLAGAHFVNASDHGQPGRGEQARTCRPCRPDGVTRLPAPSPRTPRRSPACCRIEHCRLARRRTKLLLCRLQAKTM